MPLESGQTLSHYRLLERIGEGGMGVVWKAEDTVLGRTVAIKVLPADASRDDERRAAFLKEAKLASSVSDAHIVEVYDFGQEGDLDFIVMAHVEGKSLDKLLHGRPLPADKVVGIGLQVARGLSRAHKKGLVHRDLKPQNVLVSPEGDVKIVDFGLAVLFERADSELATQSTTERDEDERPGWRPVAGTLPYMSPEQVRGERLDGRSDIFSLGVMLYEMTTGRRPFEGGTRNELLREILRGRPVPVHDLVSKVPVELDRIVRKALAPKVGDRYQTVDDMVVDLRRLARELESGESVSYEELRSVLKPERRRWMRLGVPVAIAVLVGSVMVWWFGPRGVTLDPDTILVLPFEVRGQEEGADFVGSAFAKAVAVGLTEIDGLEVVPVPDILPDASTDGIAKIAARFGAGRVIVGSIERRGAAATVSAELLDPIRQRLIWGEERTSETGELPWLAGAVVSGVAATAGYAQPQRYRHPGEFLSDPDFAESPLASQAMHAYGEGDFSRTLLLSSALVEEVPGSLAAHALRMIALLDAYDLAGDSESWHVPPIKREIAFTREIDPDNPYATWAEGFLARKEGDYERSADIFSSLVSRTDLSKRLKAVVLRQRADAKRLIGDDSAVHDIERATELAPAEAGNFHFRSVVFRQFGRLDEGVVAARHYAALRPVDPRARFFLGLTLSDSGKHEEAVLHFESAYRDVQSQEYGAMYATALIRTGERERALEIARRARMHPDKMFGLYNLACFYAVAGESAEALAFLRGAVARGYRNPWIARDPDLELLHGNPDFESLVEEVHQRASGQ